MRTSSSPSTVSPVTQRPLALASLQCRQNTDSKAQPKSNWVGLLTPSCTPHTLGWTPFMSWSTLVFFLYPKSNCVRSDGSEVCLDTETVYVLIQKQFMSWYKLHPSGMHLPKAITTQLWQVLYLLNHKIKQLLYSVISLIVKLKVSSTADEIIAFSRQEVSTIGTRSRSLSL